MQQILNASNIQVVMNRKMAAAAGLLLACTLGLGLLLFQALRAAQTPTALPISAAALEARYGMRIDLLAVTAAGGKVDLRIKILDAAKAKTLLGAAENYPSLRLAGSGVALSIPADQRPSAPLADGASFFLLFPNAGDAIKPGAPVSIQFGAISLEAIKAR